MKRLALFLLGSTVAAWAQIRFVDGRSVAFGDPIADVAKRMGEPAFESDPGRANGLQTIATYPVRLEFDAGRLWRAQVVVVASLAQPIAPFGEEWRDFGPIDGEKVSHWMSREKFETYLEAWQRRAASLGKMEGTAYWLRRGGSVAGGREISILFAPTRRVVGTGTLTGDSWEILFFPEKNDPRSKSVIDKGVLRSLTITADNFSTRDRGVPGRAEDITFPPPVNPALAGVILPDGTQLYFGQSRAEAERLAGKVTATDPRSRNPMLAFARESVGFSEDRLYAIMQNFPSRAPESFPEAWKNFTPIGPRELTASMTPEEFGLYLDAWEARAAASGKIKGRHFARVERSSALGPTVTIALQPREGAAVPDSWHVTFRMYGTPPNRGMRIQSLTAVCGAFVTKQVSGVPRLEDAGLGKGLGVPDLGAPKLPEIALPKL